MNTTVLTIGGYLALVLGLILQEKQLLFVAFVLLIMSLAESLDKSLKTKIVEVKT